MKLRFKNLVDLQKAFPTEVSCHQMIAKMRWGKTPVCVHCGSFRKIYTLKGGMLFKCADCRKPFTVRIGTIFEDSPLPLQKWFFAMWVVTAHKKGISSVQLSKDIGVTQKTAWFMLHRIRYMMQTPKGKTVVGIVEVDETFIGGERRGVGKGKGTINKPMVMGVVERGGDVIAQTVPNASAETLQGIVFNTISKSSTIMSDEWSGYRGLDREYDHKTVNHKEEEYVRHGYIHTNTIEGFWSLLKRGIVGIYHQVSRKHLDKYVDEFEFRYNSRKMNDSERFEKSLTRFDGRLMYKTLIAQ